MSQRKLVRLRDRFPTLSRMTRWRIRTRTGFPTAVVLLETEYFYEDELEAYEQSRRRAKHASAAETTTDEAPGPALAGPRATFPTVTYDSAPADRAEARSPSEEARRQRVAMAANGITPVPTQQAEVESNKLAQRAPVIAPREQCVTHMRVLVLGYMKQIPQAEWSALTSDLRNEINDIERSAKTGASEPAKEQARTS